MNDTTEDNPIGDIMEILIDQGFGGMDQAMTILINEAMKIERAHVLQQGHSVLGSKLLFQGVMQKFIAI